MQVGGEPRGAPVVNVRLFPLVVPEELVPTTLKLYNVEFANELTLAVTEIGFVPLPIACAVVLKGYVIGVALMPYPNQIFVSTPFGFTVPFSVAELAVTLVAGLVAQTGDGAMGANVRLFPYVVPKKLLPTTLKLYSALKVRLLTVAETARLTTPLPNVCDVVVTVYEVVNP